MRSLNKAMLIGNTGGVPEIRSVPSGARVAQFSLATTRRWNDRNGVQQEKTEWHRIIVWDSLKGTFDFVEKYVGKGDRLYIEGSIEYGSYDKEGGGRVYTTEIRATEVIAAGSLSRESGESGDSGRRVERRELAAVGGGMGGDDYGDFRTPPFEDDDDLPF